MRKLLLSMAVVGLGVTAASHAAGVQLVDPGTLTTNTIDDFESYTGGSYPGTAYDSVLVGNGISYGECFGGQSLTANGFFDVVNGSPVSALSLQAGATDRNVSVWEYGLPGNQVLTGLGDLGFPAYDSVGEGAVAIMFDEDQNEWGLDLVAMTGGSVTFTMYDRDGTVIDTILMSNPTDGSYAFRRDAEQGDIAGVVITNADIGGVLYDNIRFSQTVPAPGALALLGLAGLARRRRRA